MFFPVLTWLVKNLKIPGTFSRVSLPCNINLKVFKKCKNLFYPGMKRMKWSIKESTSYFLKTFIHLKCFNQGAKIKIYNSLLWCNSNKEIKYTKTLSQWLDWIQPGENKARKITPQWQGFGFSAPDIDYIIQLVPERISNPWCSLVNF